MGLLVDLTTQTPWPTLQLLLPAPLPFHSPCIALYEVDIPCAYKVSFRLPLCTPTMGDRAVFCARNMPLDLEHDFIQRWFIPGWFPTRKRLVICGNALFDRWFPSKNGLNMSHHPLERNMSPQWFRGSIFLSELSTWQSTLCRETCPFRKEFVLQPERL